MKLLLAILAAFCFAMPAMAQSEHIVPGDPGVLMPDEAPVAKAPSAEQISVCRTAGGDTMELIEVLASGVTMAQVVEATDKEYASRPDILAYLHRIVSVVSGLGGIDDPVEAATAVYKKCIEEKWTGVTL